MKKLNKILMVLVLVSFISTATLVTAHHPRIKTYEYFTPSDNGSSFDSAYGKFLAYQTFTPQLSHKIVKVSLLMAKNGNPGYVKLSLKATDSSGKPTGSDLTYGYANCDDLGIYSYQWKTFTMKSNYYLKANIKYALVLSDTNGDDFNRPFFRYAPWGGYARGNSGLFSPNINAWYPYLNSDILFIEYGL